MTIIRNLTFIALLAVLLAACAAPSVATINGEPITAEQFQERYIFDTYVWTAGGVTAEVNDPEAVALIVLETLIDERLVYQHAEEAGITANEMEVRNFTQNLLGQSLEAVVGPTAEGTGLPEDRVRFLWTEQMRGNVIAQKLSEHYGELVPDLLAQWRADADIEINDAWKMHIPEGE